MSKLVSSLAFASTLLCLSCLSAAPASAYSVVTYVSGKGVDTGACATPATACRTFQFAFNQTFPGGEIKALDAANYWPVTINRSVSITGVEGAGITRFIAGAAITISAGANDKIRLSGLTIDGFNRTATNGVLFNSGGELIIKNCTARNFSQAGIALRPTGATKFLIADVVASGNGDGIGIIGQESGSVKGTLDHVVANMNSSGGVVVSLDADVAAVDSVANDNSGSGFSVFEGTLRLAHSFAMRNNFGVNNLVGTAFSAGNNFFKGNNVDVSGTLTVLGTQ